MAGELVRKFREYSSNNDIGIEDFVSLFGDERYSVLNIRVQNYLLSKGVDLPVDDINRFAPNEKIDLEKIGIDNLKKHHQDTTEQHIKNIFEFSPNQDQLIGYFNQIHPQDPPLVVQDYENERNKVRQIETINQEMMNFHTEFADLSENERSSTDLLAVNRYDVSKQNYNLSIALINTSLDSANVAYNALTSTANLPSGDQINEYINQIEELRQTVTQEQEKILGYVTQAQEAKRQIDLALVPLPVAPPIRPNLDNFIDTEYQKARVAVQKCEDSLTIAKSNLKKFTTSNFWIGKKPTREQAWAADTSVKNSQDKLDKAQSTLARWTKAKTARDIELEKITKQQPIIERLEVELNALNALNAEADINDQAITQKKANLDGAKAVRAESEMAIKSIVRSFGGDNTLVNTDTLLLERGDNGFGFHSQVISSTEVSNELKRLNTDIVIDDSDRGRVILQEEETHDLYYLNTPVEKTEVIMSTKRYSSGAQACIVQSINSRGKLSVVDQSIGITDDDADEVAMQTALMFILNRGRGNSIVLRGDEREKIEKVHATLLWMKYLPKDSFQTMVKDVLKGKLPKNSNLDISKLDIISNKSAPEIAKGMMSKSQKTLDHEFIKMRMPHLDTSTLKKRLDDIKAEQKGLIDSKNTKEIIGPSVRGLGQ